MLDLRPARFYDRYFAGTCLLVVRLDGAPGDSLDRLTSTTGVLMATFFEILAFGALTIAFGFESTPLVYQAVVPVTVILFVANWAFGNRREAYRALLSGPKSERKRLVIFALSLNMAAFFGLAIVGYVRLS